MLHGNMFVLDESTFYLAALGSLFLVLRPGLGVAVRRAQGRARTVRKALGVHCVAGSEPTGRTRWCAEPFCDTHQSLGMQAADATVHRTLADA